MSDRTERISPRLVAVTVLCVAAAVGFAVCAAMEWWAWAAAFALAAYLLAMVPA